MNLAFFEKLNKQLQEYEEDEQLPELPILYNAMNDPDLNIFQSDMFPEGIPDTNENNFPFYPTHQYVNFAQCRNDGLRRILDVSGNLLPI